MTNQEIREKEIEIWNSLTKEEQVARREANREARKERRKLHRKTNEVKWKKKMLDAPEKLGRLKTRIESANKLFSLDLEFHEFTKVVTEVGVTLFYPQTGEIVTRHFIVKEFLKRNNRKYVPNHKHNFEFGESEILSLDEIMDILPELVDGSDFLVGHSFSNDKLFLQQCGCGQGINVLDTQTYSQFYFKEHNRMSLELICERLEIETKYLHNAGNDSYYTMLSLLHMKNPITD